MVKVYEFTVVNADGRAVQWRGNTLPARRSWEVYKRLSVAVLPALGTVAQSVLGAASFSTVMKAAGGDVGQLAVDLDRLGVSLGDFARVILEQDTEGKLIKDLLQGMRRLDPVGDDPKWQDVNAVFDDAFAGNLKELLTALTRIIRENYADFLSGFSGIAARSLEPAKTTTSAGNG